MSRRGLQSRPSVVQLPGGIRLDGMRFKLVERDEQGRPKMFEVLPPEDKTPDEEVWILYAHEESIRKPKEG
jgi:hypothetical protein